MPTMSDSGKRAGLLVLIASFAGHGGNYLFYVVAARMVTPAEFAAISALIAFGTITWMPVNGVQMSVTRNVAVLRTSGTPAELSAYLRQQGRRMGIACLVIAGVIAGLSPVLADRLHLGSPQPVLLAALWIGTTCMLLVLTGATQGMERFGYVAFALAGPLGALRPLLLPLCLLAAGMSGSMWAMIIATLIGLAVMFPPVVRAAKPAPSTPPASTNTLTTMIGLLAFSSLTNVDLLVGQAMLAEADRAVYAGAVLLGKVALFAPAALAMVLLPRAAAALERGESAERAVLKTLALTGAAGLSVALVLWLMPTWVLTVTFGPTYAASKPLLPALALVMTAAALLWVHLTFAIARKSTRMVVGLVGIAVGHWVLLALLHGSPWQVILASGLAVGTALVVVETGSRSGSVRMLLRTAKAGKAAIG
ncbi:lipopolysaccharide biosynthesis protein [Saccharothrix isguenensis]